MLERVHGPNSKQDPGDIRRGRPAGMTDLLDKVLHIFVVGVFVRYFATDFSLLGLGSCAQCSRNKSFIYVDMQNTYTVGLVCCAMTQALQRAPQLTLVAAPYTDPEPSNKNAALLTEYA